MRTTKIIKRLLNVNRVKIDDIYFVWDNTGETCLIVRVDPYKADKGLCPKCGRRCPGYDQGTPNRRWRSLDICTFKVYIECPLPRIECPEHGVLAQAVSWAHQGSLFTKDFEVTVTWLTRETTRIVVSYFMRINWRTVGNIIKRVYDDHCPPQEKMYDGLKRIGIDETSYKKGHKYLMVVVNHDTGKLVWAGKGKSEEALDVFFELLTQKHRDNIELVTADAAQYIANCVSKWCSNAVRSMDPFHVVQWATNALDAVRKRLWREELKRMTAKTKGKRGRPKKGEEKNTKDNPASTIKGLRYTILKNPENLTSNQSAALDMLVKTNPELYRAYVLKEGLRLIFKLPVEEAREALDVWRGKAWRSRIPEFVELQRTIRTHKEQILKSIELGVSNARLEAINNKIKVTIRMGYGFRNMDNLIALLMLKCSNISVRLPGRAS